MQTSKQIKNWQNTPKPIGIFGGTFDPIQIAHTRIARIASDKKKLGSVVFIPAKQNPLKSMIPTASDADRLAMLELALSEYRDFFLSTLELERPGDEPSYTVRTLREIRSQVDSPLYFIAGGDVLKGLSKWREVDEIFSLLDGFIVVERDEPVISEIEKLRGVLQPSQVEVLLRDAISTTPIPVSSSDVRNEIAEGKDVRLDLLPSVYGYIQKTGLYASTLKS